MYLTAAIAAALARPLGVGDGSTRVPVEQGGKFSQVTNFTTQTERRRAIREAIQTDPDASNREIADRLGVTHPTVGNVRQTFENPGDPVPRNGRRASEGVATGGSATAKKEPGLQRDRDDDLDDSENAGDRRRDE